MLAQYQQAAILLQSLRQLPDRLGMLENDAKVSSDETRVIALKQKI